MTGAAGARADPEHAAAILIQRHHIVIAQTVRIVRVAAVAHEVLRRAIEEVEAVGGRDPQPVRIVFHDRAHAIVAERARVARVVTKDRHLPRLRIETMQAAVERADPQRARVILEQWRAPARRRALRLERRR